MVKYILILIVTLSLQAKLDFNGLHSDFMKAIKNNNFTMIYSLVKKLDNFDFFDKELNTPLHLAVRMNNKKLVKNILERGAHTNLYNRDGLTPLHIAVQNNFLYMVKILMYYNSYAHAKDNQGNTPLYYAKLLQYNHIIDILLPYSVEQSNLTINNDFNNFIKNFNKDAIQRTGDK